MRSKNGFRKNKYGNHKVVIAGIEYDSQKEADRYKELQLLEKAGKIENIKRQVPFELIPKQTEIVERYSDKTGKRLKDKEKTLEHPCSYIADFVYYDREAGQWIVEDAKGYKTPEYKIKRKLMLYVHGIKIREV